MEKLPRGRLKMLVVIPGCKAEVKEPPSLSPG